MRALLGTWPRGLGLILLYESQEKAITVKNQNDQNKYSNEDPDDDDDNETLEKNEKKNLPIDQLLEKRKKYYSSNKVTTVHQVNIQYSTAAEECLKYVFRLIHFSPYDTSYILVTKPACFFNFCFACTDRKQSTKI